MSLYCGPFFEYLTLPWQGCITSVIRNGLCSTGYCFTILTNFLQNIRIFLRESTAIFAQSFKKLLRNTSTVAIRSVGLRGFDAEIAVGRIGSLFRYFTILAILIACFGLFGLSAYIAEQRTKEIGIRKILGATVPNVTLLLSRQFIKWVLFANLAAWPFANFIMKEWLNNFAYRTRLGLDVFILSGLVTLVIALLTVSFQSIKATLAKPADNLRYE